MMNFVCNPKNCKPFVHTFGLQFAQKPAFFRKVAKFFCVLLLSLLLLEAQTQHWIMVDDVLTGSSGVPHNGTGLARNPSAIPDEVDTAHGDERLCSKDETTASHRRGRRPQAQGVM